MVILAQSFGTNAEGELLPVILLSIVLLHRRQPPATRTKQRKMYAQTLYFLVLS